MSSPVRQLIRAAASLGSLQLGSMVLTFVVGVLLARQLGPAGYGVYALAMATTALAGLLTEFGLPILTMREFARAQGTGEWSDARGLLRWANSMILALSAVLLGGFFLAAQVWDFHQGSAFLATMVWAILLIPVVALAKLRGLALLAMGHTLAGQFAVLIMRPGVFALILAGYYLLAQALDPVGAMIAQVLAAASALATVAVLFQRLQPAPLRAARPQYHRRAWLAATLPMGASEGLRLLQGQMGVFLLGLIATSTAVGHFRVADAASAIVLVPTTILNVVAGPQFARLHAAGEHEELQRVLSVTSLAITAGVAVLAVPIWVAGEWLVTLAFGARFADATPALEVLVTGWLVVTLLGPCTSLANMTGDERAVTGGFLVAVAVQLAVGVLLIPYLGPEGAALGVIAGQLLLNGLLAVRIHRRTGLI